MSKTPGQIQLYVQRAFMQVFTADKINPLPDFDNSFESVYSSEDYMPPFGARVIGILQQPNYLGPFDTSSLADDFWIKRYEEAIGSVAGDVSVRIKV